MCNTNGDKKYIHLKKGSGQGIEDFVNFAPTFCFPPRVETKGFSRYTRRDPQNGKQCLAALISCHEILWNMSPMSKPSLYCYCFFTWLNKQIIKNITLKSPLWYYFYHSVYNPISIDENTSINIWKPFYSYPLLILSNKTSFQTDQYKTITLYVDL